MRGDVLNNDNETCHNKLKRTNHALDALLVFISLSNGYMFYAKLVHIIRALMTFVVALNSWLCGCTDISYSIKMI